MSNPSNQTIIARWKNVRCFATVIRSPEAVRSAFKGQKLLAWWWRVILALHGKPTQNHLTSQEHCECIADGFRFYGWLYRMLGILFGAGTLLCLRYGLADFYWLTLLTFGGVYLWAAGGLAISGATTYSNSRGGHVWLLVAFLFFIALFLASTLMLFSAQVRLSQWVPDTINIVVTLGLLIFGVGSYLIELGALVANERTRVL